VLRQLRSERGETFIELVVSCVLLGILGIGMITALSGAIIVSHADRGFAGTETVLRSYATTLERRPYKSCTPGSSNNPYSASDLAFSAPTGYTTSVTAVKFLNNKNANNVVGAFVTACPTAANGGDQGVQQLTVRAVRTDGTAAQTVNVLLRQGDT
jgi:Tfp pilus assembly protein PilE